MELQWNVYRVGCHKNEVDYFNIFRHGDFYCEVKEALAKADNKEDFSAKVRSSLFYYFCSKYEWEIGITEPFPHITKEEVDRLAALDFKRRESVNLETHKKIDVYQQIMINFDHFIDYIWQNKENI